LPTWENLFQIFEVRLCTKWEKNIFLREQAHVPLLVSHLCWRVEFAMISHIVRPRVLANSLPSFSLIKYLQELFFYTWMFLDQSWSFWKISSFKAKNQLRPLCHVWHLFLYECFLKKQTFKARQKEWTYLCKFKNTT
jgi:hypothetical protein